MSALLLPYQRAGRRRWLPRQGIHPGLALARSATAYWDASRHDGSQTLKNWGTGGSALDLTLGSTGSADSNDPTWLQYAGTPYIYFPGVSGNYASVPDAANLDFSDTFGFSIRVSMDDWTPGATSVLFSKAGAGGSRSYQLVVGTDGKLNFRYTTDGTTYIDNTCTTAPSFTDGVTYWINVSRDPAIFSGNVIYGVAADSPTLPSFSVLGSVAWGGGSMFNSTSVFAVGADSAGTGNLFAGKFYRLIASVSGSTVLDIDTSVITTASEATFTATTGQTVTINRSTSGRKTTVVAAGGSRFLFGTDDYMEKANNALLDFDAATSGTFAAVARLWATPATNGRLISKRNSGSSAGWAVDESTTFIPRLVDSDGTNTVTAVTPASSSGTLQAVVAVLDRAAQTNTVYINGVAGSPLSTSSVGSLSNSVAFRIGATANGTGFQDFVFTAAVVDRRAWSAGEALAFSNYITTRRF